MNEDEERLHQHLDEHPEDWEARLVLADLEEERGRMDIATGLRWLVDNKKRADNEWGDPPCFTQGWHWWARLSGKEHSILPDDVGDALYEVLGVEERQQKDGSRKIIVQAKNPPQ